MHCVSAVGVGIQIYNVDKRIQEDNLQHLALFSEYGRMALSSNAKDSAEVSVRVCALMLNDGRCASGSMWVFELCRLVRNGLNSPGLQSLDPKQPECQSYNCVLPGWRCIR